MASRIDTDTQKPLDLACRHSLSSSGAVGTRSPAKGKQRKIVERTRALGVQLFSVRRKIATVAAVVLAAMLGYHVVFGRNGLTAFSNKRHDLHDLQAQVTTLQRENGELQGHVDRLTSDPNAIEHQAREDLHYTRPGEVIYTLAPSQQADPTPPKPSR